MQNGDGRPQLDERELKLIKLNIPFFFKHLHERRKRPHGSSPSGNSPFYRKFVWDSFPVHMGFDLSLKKAFGDVLVVDSKEFPIRNGFVFGFNDISDLGSARKHP